MMSKPVSGPHVVATQRVDTVMRQVVLALLPAVGFGILLFGWSALYLTAITLASALLFEAWCLKIKGVCISAYLNDYSAMVTGLLVVMTLPPWAPWWIGVVGSAIAIILGKQVYGGLGQNLFNPAMLARVGIEVNANGQPGAILCIVGARPNFMKMAPILRALAAHQPPIPALLVHTGQHYDASMSDQLFEDLRLPRPDLNLEVGYGVRDLKACEQLATEDHTARTALLDLRWLCGDRALYRELEVGLVGSHRVTRGEPRRVARRRVAGHAAVPEHRP